MTRQQKGGLAMQSAADAFDVLYAKLLAAFYGDEDRDAAERIAAQLEAILATESAIASSIRGEEVRSMLAELKGDLPTAIHCREAEIRKILQLHAVTMKPAAWKHVLRQYDFSDVADRLDLLAILYDRHGDLDRAIATLQESQQYCQSHRICFDGQDVLDELEQEREAAAKRLANRQRKSPASSKRRGERPA
jgi:hypothetical protein